MKMGPVVRGGAGVAFLVALTGCATTTVTMKHPTTGQIHVCQRPTFGSLDAATSCADALKRDGWIELGRD